MVKGKVFEVELCEELYREMSVEEFIRRGMRMLLVMILFLSMVLGVSLMTPGKGLTVIDMKYAGTLSLQDGILPDVFGNYEAEVVLPMEEKTADLPAALPDEMIFFTTYVMIYEEVLIPDHGETDKGDPADFFQVIPEQITEEEVLTRQDTGVVLSAEESPMSIPAAETPTLSIPEASVPENDIPVPDLAGPDSSEPDVPAVENGLMLLLRIFPNWETEPVICQEKIYRYPMFRQRIFLYRMRQKAELLQMTRRRKRPRIRGWRRIPEQKVEQMREYPVLLWMNPG